METSALLKTHLFQTNLSRDSGLTSSDTQLYSEHMEPHAIPATDLQARKKSLTRSTSQFDEAKPKEEPGTVLSNSYDGSLNIARDSDDIPPPVPPPRKSRRKAPDPPSNVRPIDHSDKSPEVQCMKWNVNEQTNVSTSRNTKRNPPISRQRSSESIGSRLEDYSESVDSGDYPDGTQRNPERIYRLQCSDTGELYKSSNGAKIYLDGQLLSDSLPSGNQACSEPPPTTTASSSLPAKQPAHKDIKRTPLPMKEPPSYEESVLRARGKAAEIRAKSANRHSWNVSPEHPAKHGQPGAGNIPQHLNSVRSHKGNEAEDVSVERSKHSNQVPGDVYCSPGDNIPTVHHASGQSNVGNMCSSVQELHSDSILKQNEGAYIHQIPVRRNSAGTLPQMMYTPPEPKRSSRDLVLKTFLAERCGNKEEVLRKVRVGMTAKGGDIFPKHMRSIIRHGLHEEKSVGQQKSSGARVIRNTGRVDDVSPQVKPQRSESFGARQRPQQIDHVVQTHSIEKSASDTSVVDQFENNAKHHRWKRPSKPPTYQEAIQRKSLLKSGLPLYQVSQQDVQQQREKSSKAAQLYQESMKRYQLQADDPNDNRANEGHVTADSTPEEIRIVQRNNGVPFQRDQLPTRQSHDAPYKREPPPTREVENKPTNARKVDEVDRQPGPVNIEKHKGREMDPPADEHRRHREHHTTEGEKPSHTSPQRHTVTPRHTEQALTSKLYREQRRNSDPRNRNSNSRNRKDDVDSNAAISSLNELRLTQRSHIDECKIRKEQTSRQQAPSYYQGSNKERQNKKSKPREQRLSDTRLENNKSNELHRLSKSGLTRSKSDSSEHLNKLGRFKELQALDSNIIEQYRKSKLNAENEALKDSQGFVGRPRRRSINSVRHRDWHKDLGGTIQ